MTNTQTVSWLSMVAEKVQIRTLSRQEGSKAVQWESNGSPEYSITEIEKEDRGTDIVLFISEESKEFLLESDIIIFAEESWEGQNPNLVYNVVLEQRDRPIRDQ